jgi:hypothetical protein
MVSAVRLEIGSTKPTKLDAKRASLVLHGRYYRGRPLFPLAKPTEPAPEKGRKRRWGIR